MPRCSDSAAFSAACRHTEQLRKRASPSFHSLLCLSKVRGVDATEKFATAAPDGVKRSSGSAVRLPTTVMGVSPAMSQASSLEICRCCPTRATGGIGRVTRCSDQDAPETGTTWGSANVGTNDLSAQHRLVQRKLTVELLHRGRLGLQLDDGVDAFGVLVDLVGQAATSPDVDLLDRATVLDDDVVEVLLQRRRNGALFEVGVEDDHHFIGTQSGLHLLRTQAATASP